MNKEDVLLDYMNLLRDDFAIILSEVREVEHKRFRMLCLFSVLDSFSQAYWNNIGNSGKNIKEKEKFVGFINKFQSKWDFLNSIDPVTLFYDIDEFFVSNNCLTDDNEVNWSIELLADNIDFDGTKLCSQSIFNVDLNMILQLIYDLIRETKISNDALCARIKRHSFVELLYRMRCKITHELSSLGSFLKEDLHDIPYYMERGYISNYNNKITSNDEIILIFPEKFLTSLIEECVYNFLDFCEESDINPFPFSRVSNKSYFSWHYN